MFPLGSLGLLFYWEGCTCVSALLGLCTASEGEMQDFSLQLAAYFPD